MYKIFSIVLVCFFVNIHAQELNCKVIINYDKVTNVNSQVFKTLEASLKIDEFIISFICNNFLFSQ